MESGIESKPEKDRLRNSLREKKRVFAATKSISTNNNIALMRQRLYQVLGGYADQLHHFLVVTTKSVRRRKALGKKAASSSTNTPSSGDD
jgi:hypothetical protein